MKRWNLIFVLMMLASMVAFAACSSDDTTLDGDEPDGDVTEDGDTTDGDVPDGDDPDGDEPDGDVVEDGDMADGDDLSGIGGACADKTECTSNFCLTATTIAPLIADFQGDIANGYCTVLMCKTDGSDGKCTAEMNATCFSLYPFAGEDFAALGICLALCESDADCREADGNSCLDPQGFVDAGFMSQEDKDTFYGDSKGCLPDSVAAAALAALQPDGDVDEEAAE
jgi:hypothetical protein